MSFVSLLLVCYAGVSLICILVVYAACVASSRAKRVIEVEEAEANELMIAMPGQVKPII
jgi:hypothetical protein